MSRNDVSVSYQDFADEDFDMLESIELDRTAVRITTQRREYALDTRAVDREETTRAAEILHKLNFDGCFLLTVGPV